MAHFVKGGAQHARILTIVEKSTAFGLGGRRKNVAHDSATDVDGAIERRRAVWGRWD